MRKVFAVLLASVLLFLAAMPAFAAETAEYVGTINNAPKSLLSESFYTGQCELGCVIADAVRTMTEADAALIPAGVIENDLIQGDVTMEDVRKVFTRDEALFTAEIVPADLYELLEVSVSHLKVDPTTEMFIIGTDIFDGFCQVSGFRFRFDASAPVGERVLKVTLDDGTELSAEDSDTRLRLAVTGSLKDGTYGHPEKEYEATGETVVSALAAYVAGHADLPEGETDRISVIGTRTETIAGQFPHGMLTVGFVLMAILVAVMGRRLRRREEDPYGGEK